MFSDKNLKQLKETSGRVARMYFLTDQKISALLARLEAAEHLIMCIQEGLNFTRAEKAWRKAARK